MRLRNLIFCTLVVCVCVPAQNPPKTAPPDWRAIHQSAIIIDGHADTPQRFVDEGFDMASDAGTGQMDLAKIRAGNLAQTGRSLVAHWSTSPNSIGDRSSGDVVPAS